MVAEAEPSRGCPWSRADIDLGVLPIFAVELIQPDTQKMWDAMTATYTPFLVWDKTAARWQGKMLKLPQVWQRRTTPEVMGVRIWKVLLWHYPPSALFFLSDFNLKMWRILKVILDVLLLLLEDIICAYYLCLLPVAIICAYYPWLLSVPIICTDIPPPPAPESDIHWLLLALLHDTKQYQIRSWKFETLIQ